MRTPVLFLINLVFIVEEAGNALRLTSEAYALEHELPHGNAPSHLLPDVRLSFTQDHPN